jgi:hypothetical protein
VSFPLVPVLRDKHLPGVGSLIPRDGQVPTPLELFELDDALGRVWDTDAHFVCYLPYHGDTPDIKDGVWRLRKEILREIRIEGGSVRTVAFGVDLDNVEHAAWTPELLTLFQEKCRAVFGGNAVPAPTWIYTTAHGARFVYVLEDAIEAVEGEERHRGLLKLLGDVGFVCDPLSDWTRCFRLPLVTRDGKPTWDAPYFWIEERKGERLDASTLPRIKAVQNDLASPTAHGVENPASDPPPEVDEARTLLEVAGKPTAFLKHAKKVLVGRACYPVIFEHRSLAERGERDKMLMRMVGEASALLHDAPGYTADHLYALFLAPVQELEPDEGTPDWLKKLWYCVGYCWSRQEAAQLAQTKVAVQAVEQQGDVLASMAAGMRAWCKAPELVEAQSDAARSFVLRHLIVVANASYHLLGPDGWIDKMPVRRDSHIPARMRELGLDVVVPLVEIDKQGMAKPVSIQKLLTNHATFISCVEGSLAADKCFVENLGERDAKLVLSLFQIREDLEPEWSEHVARWMELLVGKQRVQELERWIAWALDFKAGPICALSLVGPPGVGKKMLAAGMAECLNTETFASGLDIIQRFPQALFSTGIVVVDEGLPSTTMDGLDIADAFRRMVSGDMRRLDRKFLDSVDVRVPARVMFLANNLDVIAQLGRHRNLSPDDQAALAQRILHFDVNEDAAAWLRGLGGTRFTHGWIKGDAGEQSKYVIAKHFLFLYQNRDQFPRDSRFLVEGSRDQPFLEEMRTNSGSAPLVVELLIRMIESTGAVGMRGIAIEPGKLFVSANGVIEFSRNYSRGTLGQGRAPLNHRQVSNVFRGLQTKEAANTPEWSVAKKMLNGEVLRSRWWQLDPVVLLRESLVNGLPHDRLLELARVIDNDEARAMVKVAAGRSYPGGE